MTAVRWTPARTFWRRLAFALTLSGGIAMADVSLSYHLVPLSVVIYALALVLCTVAAMRASSVVVRNLVILLMILPIVRLIGLASAVPDLPRIYWYVFGAIALTALVITLFRATSLGFAVVWKRPDVGWPTAAAIFSGVPIGMALALVNPLALGHMRDSPVDKASILVTLLVAAVVEQHLIRGIVQPVLSSVLRSPASFVTTAAFATYLYWPIGAAAIVLMAVWQLVLAHEFQRSRSIIPSIIGQGLVTIMMVLMHA